MWYPSSQQQYQQHNCYEYPRHHSPQQQTYSRTAYYYNGDELSTTCLNTINDENESSIHCQTTYGSNVHVITPNSYVTTSLHRYGDEMSSYQTTSTKKTYWNPAIVAPTKPMNVITPSLPVASSRSSATACWDWLLFSPEYYSELYIPSSTYVHYSQEKVEDGKNDHFDVNFLGSLPSCLLSLLSLTPKLIRTSDDENDSDQEIGSLVIPDEPLLSSLSINKIDKRTNNISSNNNSHIDGQNLKENRSSTPDTDDGYQSASDASRSDYSQQSSIPCDHQHTRDNRPTPLMPPRISYAAAVKPITPTSTITNKLSSLPSTNVKPKQVINKTLSATTNTNEMLNANGQKLKFIAPRFERMHHAKQYSSSSSSSTTIKTSSSSSSSLSNRTQLRSTNYHQRNHIVNSTRRR